MNSITRYFSRWYSPNYERLARKAGWADFEDVEDSTLLVVAHDDFNVHFTGPDAWQEAVEYMERSA